MDQRGLHPLPFVCEEIHFPTEKQGRFWKTESTQDCNEIGSEGISMMSIKRSDTSSLLEQHSLGVERMSSLPMTSRKVIDQDVRLWSDLNMMPLSQCAEGNRVDFNAPEYENSLFSSSFSDIFKLRLSPNDILLFQSIDTVASHFEEDELFESHEDIEVETIGNLLPDDDELLLGVIDELEYTARANTGDNKDDFDLFNSIGGMELEADGDLSFSEGSKSSDFVGGIPSGLQIGSNGLIAGEHPYGEHPSRTLFVRNINSNVDDLELKALFEQYGDIRTFHTGCKHRGFVMISYYDIRAAHNAMKALQNKPLRRCKLDIHFSIPKGNPSDKDINHGTLVVFNLDSSVSNDELWRLFGVYGEIKEIRETPHKHHHKFIEFYDVRAAEAALHALNRSDIAGKRIKLEPSRPWGARRWSMQQFSPELEQDETGGSWQWGSPPNSSLQERSGSVPQESITSGCLDNGVISSLHSTIRPSISPFAESPFHGISASVPHSLSSLTRPISVGNHSNQSGLDGSRWSLDQMQFGFHRMPALHPHSFSEYHHDGLSNVVSTMEASINSRPIEGSDDRQIHRICSGGPNARFFEINGGVFGASKKENYPLHGQCHPWSNSHLHRHPPPPGPMMWPNSPPFVNRIHAHPQHQMHGLARARSRSLSIVAPLQHPNYYVGSAPAVYPSFWDKQQAYPPEHAEASDFHPGSLGNMGFSGSSALHLLELAPHNIFPHLGGKYIDPSISTSNIGFPLPHQRSHMFPSRNPMIPMSTSFDSPHEQIRGWRNGANSCQADIKKQYELDISRILRVEDTRTTLMIKNIPNKYTSKMLMATIDEHHQGAYDFIYLPIDFKNKCNVGYAFINLIGPMKIVSFYQALNGKKWEKFNSEKVASLAYARIQGKAALIAHFQNSSLMNEDKRCRPILFHTDGPSAGNQEPFPVGPNIRSRLGQTHTNSDENHQGSSAVSISGDESSSRTGSSGSSNGIE